MTENSGKFDFDKEINEINKINKNRPKEADIVSLGNLSDEGLAEILSRQEVSPEERQEILDIAKKVKEKEEFKAQKEIDSILKNFKEDADADLKALSEELTIQLGLFAKNKKFIEENKIKLEEVVKEIEDKISSKNIERQRDLFDRLDVLSDVWNHFFSDNKKANKDELEK